MAKAVADNKPTKKRRGIFSRFRQYVKNTIAELKKVTWPTRKTVVQYTGIVLAFICVFGIIVGLMDVGLTKLLEIIMKGPSA